MRDKKKRERENEAGLRCLQGIILAIPHEVIIKISTLAHSIRHRNYIGVTLSPSSRPYRITPSYCCE